MDNQKMLQRFRELFPEENADKFDNLLRVLQEGVLGNEQSVQFRELVRLGEFLKKNDATDAEKRTFLDEVESFRRKFRVDEVVKQWLTESERECDRRVEVESGGGIEEHY